MRFVKPVDADLAAELAGTHGLLVTIEENAVSAAREAPSPRRSPRAPSWTPLLQLGLPTSFIDHATRRNCSPRSAWTGPASSPPSARVLKRGERNAC